MADWRAIKKGICTSSRFVTMEEWEQLLFVQMVVQADQWGRLKADPLQIKMMCCPASQRSIAEIQAALETMATQGRGLVDLYVTDGTPVCQIMEWDTTQPSSYLKGRGPSSLPDKRNDSAILESHGIPRNPTLEEKRVKETRREENSLEDRSPTEPLSVSRPKPDALTPDQVFNLYQSICVPAGMVNHASLNPTMRKQIKARIRERRKLDGTEARSDGPAWWLAYFNAAAESAFLCDNANIGNLLYITGPKNMDKLLSAGFWASKEKTLFDRNAASAREALAMMEAEDGR